MTLVVLELVGLVAIFAWQARVGAVLRGPLGALIVLQAGFWAIAYVGRPAILLVAQPPPQRADAIADSRLAIRGYEQSFSQILPIVLLSCAIVLVCYLLVVRARRDLTFAIRPDVGPDLVACLVIIGWLARLASVGSDPESESGVLATVALMASVGFGTHILFSHGRGTRAWTITTAVLLMGEFGWSVVSASKTPILAALSWILISEFSSRRHIGKRVAAIALIGLVVFSFIQGVKTETGSLSSNEASAANYPAAVQPVLFLIRRLDLVSAVTDAVWAGPGRWLSPSEATAQFVGSLVPQQLNAAKAGTVGEAWANEVRAQSVENSDSGVHLAEGPVAEGFVIGGLPGVAFESLVIAVLTVVICVLLSRSTFFARVLGLSLTAQPLVLERGVLAVGEQLGKGLQIAALATLVLFVLRWANRPRTRVTSAGTRSDQEPDMARGRERAVRST